MRSLCIYRWLCIAIISIPFLVFAWTPTALALYFMSWINDLCLLEELFLCPLSASMETSLPPSLKFEVNKRKIKQPRSFARYYEETTLPSSLEEEYKKIDTIGVILGKVHEAAMNESSNGTFVDAVVATTTTSTTTPPPTNTNITTTTTTTTTARVIDTVNIDVVDSAYFYPVATNTTTTAAVAASADVITTTTTTIATTIDGGDASKKSNDDSLHLTMIAATRTTTKTTKKSFLPIFLNNSERRRNSSPETINNEEKRPVSETVLRRIGSRVLNSKQTVFFNDKCCSVDPIARIPISVKKLTLGILTIAGISISLIILSQTSRVGRWNPSVIAYEYPTERARRSFHARSRNQLNAAVWYYRNTASKDFATIKYSKTSSHSLPNVSGVDLKREDGGICHDQKHHDTCIFHNEYQTKAASDTIHRSSSHRSSSSPLEPSTIKPSTVTAYPLIAVSFVEKKSPLCLESATVKTTQGSSPLLIQSSEETSSKTLSSRKNNNRKYVLLAWSTHICYASSKRPVRSSPLFYRKQRVGIESPMTTLPSSTSSIRSPMPEIKSFIEKEIVRSTIVVFTTVTKLTTFVVVGCCLIVATMYGTPILRSCDIYHNNNNNNYTSSLHRSATTKTRSLCEYTFEKSFQSYMMSNPYKLYCCVPESRNTKTLNWFVDSLIYTCVIGLLYYVCRRYVLIGARFKDFSVVNERSNYFERLFRSKNARRPKN